VRRCGRGNEGLPREEEGPPRTGRERVKFEVQRLTPDAGRRGERGAAEGEGREVPSCRAAGKFAVDRSERG